MAPAPTNHAAPGAPAPQPRFQPEILPKTFGSYLLLRLHT